MGTLARKAILSFTIRLRFFNVHQQRLAVALYFPTLTGDVRKSIYKPDYYVLNHTAKRQNNEKHTDSRRQYHDAESDHHPFP